MGKDCDKCGEKFDSIHGRLNVHSAFICLQNRVIRLERRDHADTKEIH